MPGDGKDNKGRFLPGNKLGGRTPIPEELRAKLKAGAEEAVDFWCTLVKDTTARPDHRNKAAENLCAYAYGKPVQAIDVEERGMVTHVDTDKLTPDAREAILQMVAASVNPEADS